MAVESPPPDSLIFKSATSPFELCLSFLNKIFRVQNSGPKHFEYKIFGIQCFFEQTSFWDQEKSSSGKKFELPKKSNFFPLKLFFS